MSKRKTGHTTTKNTQKKSTKPTSIIDQLGPENPILGVMCVIDNKEQITPLRFAFPKHHLYDYIFPIDANLLELRENAMRDVGQLYYALTNYDKVKSTLGNLIEVDLFNKLVEAAGAFVMVVAQIDKESIEANFKTEDSMGCIFGFNYADNEDGSFTIEETQVGIHFTDYNSWLESTNNFKEEVNKVKN
jgi:hypothetical protein